MNVTEKKVVMASLKSFAESLGFDGFGVTSPQVGIAEKRFVDWLDAGYDGEMTYIKRGEEKRKNPDLILQGVRSILCFRKNYFTIEKDMSYVEQRDNADISIYALNKDYHDNITSRLRQMEQKIQKEVEGCRTKI